MARFFKPSKKPSDVGQVVFAKVDHLDHEGTGVCPDHSPVLFVTGGLPGERCEVLITEAKKRFWRGRVIAPLDPSDERQAPFCQYFGRCGGCQNQHLSSSALLQYKQQAVSQLVSQYMGLPEAEQPWQSPLRSERISYRNKARLAVDARDSKAPLLGFRALGSKDVVSVEQCPILEPQLQQLLGWLQVLIQEFSSTKAIGHITLVQGELTNQVAIRLTGDISKQDWVRLDNFAADHGCQILVQPKTGQDSLISGTQSKLNYRAFADIRIEVGPDDFMQGNTDVNQAMIKQALAWLAVNYQDTVLDLFCGLGNFTLPLAARCHKVIAVEGVEAMVHKGRANALANGLQHIDYHCGDLAQPDALANLNLPKVDAVLLDPSRMGAAELMPQLLQLEPAKILYVSCNPATFVRDAAVLLEQGYRVNKIGLMDMFPFTQHTEMMTLLERS